MHEFRKFTGEENHTITATEALAFIRQFREHYGAHKEGKRNIVVMCVDKFGAEKAE